MNSAADVDRQFERSAPLWWRALSPLGHEAYFPQDIPFQAKEARGTTYNGTIGVFTDGAGGCLPLGSIDGRVDLEGVDRDRAFLYSPVLGLPELRQAWAGWQRSAQGSPVPNDTARATLPIVTCGLSHGLSLVADLFGAPGRKLVLTQPFWGNYRQIFGLRRGVELITAPAYRERRYDPRALEPALAALPSDEPAMVMVNFPSNPGGYSPTAAERAILLEVLATASRERPLLVLCDDAYAGLVFPEGTGEALPSRSFFWDVVEHQAAHKGDGSRLLAIKIDGATKEFGLFGGRVGFLTFGGGGLARDLGTDALAGEAVAALESKISSLVRSTLGSPVSLSQVLLLQSLRGDAEGEVETIRRVARERAAAVRPALEALDPALLRPLPFNAGFFVLMELAPGLGLDPHDVRRYLIARHDVGLVSSSPNYLRVALCSVAAEALPEMFRRIEAGVRELVEADP